jgi:hypothetical protein
MSDKPSLGRFVVENPISYESFPLAPAEGELRDAAQKLRETMRLRPPGSTAKRAIWIVHGMGQQVPYETLEQLAEGLIRAAARSSPGIRIEPRFREVQVGNTVLQRVELLLPRPGADPREVHLYECYWAPKTEGAVQLRDVVSFLWDGGSRGLIDFATGFARALFGHMVEFSLTWRTPLYLWLTLKILAALTVINAIVIGMGASWAGISSSQRLVPPALIQPLTSVGEHRLRHSHQFRGGPLSCRNEPADTRHSALIRTQSTRLDLDRLRDNGVHNIGGRCDHGVRCMEGASPCSTWA